MRSRVTPERAPVIPCANGTDALQIAMMALDFKPGDEIILPVHTYVATAEVIALLGLVPVFVEVDAPSFNIDVTLIERKYFRRPSPLCPCIFTDSVPTWKHSWRSGKTQFACDRDAAQSLGAEYTFRDGTKKMAGTMGIIGTTSFFPSKNLGCYGDGGAIFTNDKALAEKMQMIANHGQRVKYHHDIIGVNSRLDTLQAAILKSEIEISR